MLYFLYPGYRDLKLFLRQGLFLHAFEVAQEP